MKKKWLKSCVLSILAAGVVSTGGVSQAETIDMTSAENLSGIEINSPEEEIENTYTYKWDKATKTITGGIITAKTNNKGKYINLKLQLKSSEFDSLKPADINEAVEALSAKVINDLPKDRWMVKARVEIVNDKGQVLRTYGVLSDNVNYDYENEKYPEASTGKKGNLTGALYTTTLSADDADSEYDLADHKLLLEWGDGVFMTPDYSEKRKDHIYTAIRGGTNDLILTHKSGSSTSNNTLVITSDSTASTDRRAKTYGIYHDGKGKLILQSSETDIVVKGAMAKGIFVGNESDSDVSDFVLGGDNGVYRIQVESDEGEEASGIEAGLNGIIHFEVKDPNKKTDIDVKKGAGLYAHDGGQILRKNGANGRINIKTNGYGTAVLAEKGGVINVHLNDIEGDIKTDDNEKSQITTNIYGNFNGNAVGNVNLSLFGKWNGNFDSTKDLVIRGSGVWSGSSAKDKINTLTMDPGALWKIPDVEKLPEIGELKGSKSGVKRSYIDMGKGNLVIGKLSGNFTFNYKHDAADPATILGGDVRIKAAEPLEVVEEGVGGGGDAKQTGTVPTTITVSTSAEGIDTSNASLVENVLEHLANKVYYEAYASGERKLTGTVEIAEGLTSASVSKALGDIKWDETTGQGKRGDKIQYPYTDYIFGNPEVDKAYEKNITNENGKLTYTFTEDTSIINKVTKDPRPFGWGGLYLATINNYGNNNFRAMPSKGGPSFTVDMNGHNLYIETNVSPQEGGTGNQPMFTSAGIGAFKEGTITFDNPGAIEINTIANYYYGSAIRASTAQATDKGAHVIINNSNKKENAVKIRGGITSPGYEMNYQALNATTQNGGAGNSIVIKGLVDIETQGGAAAMFAKGSKSYITVGGGRIIAKDYDSMWTVGKTARIDVNMKTDSNGEVTDAGDNPVEIVGSAATTTMWYGHGGTINIGLTTKNSKFTGNFYGSKEEISQSRNLWLRNGAVWKNAPTVYNPWSGPTGMKDFASDVTWLHGGADQESAGNILQESAHDLTIENIDGHTNIFMAHDMNYIVPEFEKDENGKDKLDGEGNKIKNPDGGKNKVFGKIGNVIVNKAEKNSMITLRTDRDGLNALSGKAVERNKVSEVLNALANKLYYTSYKDGETNLKGKVEIVEGLTAQSASYRLEDMTFKKENGQGQYVFTPETVDRPDTPPLIYGPKQTAMIRGAKSAMTTTMLSMRDNMTTMTQRLGDIHEGTEDGIWARTYGGKANYDKDLTKTKESFWGVQIGADKKQASGWHTGVSFDYQDGNATYELGGKGDPKLYTLGIYGTKVKDNGEYIDVVAKAGRGQNDYTVYNDMGHKLKGDYKANAMGLSVEYGKRIEKGDKYLTPQIQLSYMKLQGTDYDAISDYANGKKMHVEQDGMTSLVGRIGIAAGKRTDKTDLYLKANLLHEFKGTTASTFSAENEPTATVDQDFGDTWAELTLGMNHNIDKDKMIYADITKSFGGDYEMEWKANAGIRLRF